MKKPMTKTAAIKYAKTQVSELYKVGGGWRYSCYDASYNSYLECVNPTYWQARASRSCALLRHACAFLGCDEYETYTQEACLSNMGGRWVDYIPDTGLFSD